MKDYTRIECGNLILDDKVDITDPCYDKGTWCRITTECQPGVYVGYVDIVDCGVWGMRVGAITICREDVLIDGVFDWECIGDIGVDAGLAGFFNNKPDYPDDDWICFLEDNGILGDNKKEEDYYVCDCGIFSASGYGDGGYNVFANANRTAFKIDFGILNEDEEDDEDDI